MAFFSTLLGESEETVDLLKAVPQSSSLILATLRVDTPLHVHLHEGEYERLLASLAAGEESLPPGSPAASLRTISSRKSGTFSSASCTSAPRDVMLLLAKGSPPW